MLTKKFVDEMYVFMKKCLYMRYVWKRYYLKKNDSGYVCRQDVGR